MTAHMHAWASRTVLAVLSALGIIGLAFVLILTTGPRAGAVTKAAGPPHPTGVARHLGAHSGWMRGNGGWKHVRPALPRHVTAPVHKAATSLPRTARSDPAAARPGSAGTSAPAAPAAAAGSDAAPAAATAPPADATGLRAGDASAALRTGDASASKETQPASKLSQPLSSGLTAERAARSVSSAVGTERAAVAQTPVVPAR